MSTQARSARHFIYLDHAATTPVNERVVAAMNNYMLKDYGNPSSRHAFGLQAEKAIEKARTLVAKRTGVPSAQVIFTSGGTEANALAILGVTHKQPRGGHMLVSSIEHPSVLETAKQLADSQIDVEQIPVTSTGEVNLEKLAQLLRPTTFFVAVMYVNNETGICQPIKDVASIVKKHNYACHLHIDAVQAFGHFPCRLENLCADSLSISAHKIHGPKGAGALVLGARVQLAPLWGGGGQENALRSGTQNVPGIIGLGGAIELLSMPAPDYQGFAQHILESVKSIVPKSYVIGDEIKRAPHILSLGLPGYRTETLINLLEEHGVCISSGSACHSRNSLQSHVLGAMGIPRAHGSIRISFSRQTTIEEVTRAAKIIRESLKQLQR